MWCAAGRRRRCREWRRPHTDAPRPSARRPRLAEGDPSFEGVMPLDEWDAIALNYTSGTTGDPKGVVPSHRGTYLMSLPQLTDWAVPRSPVYLWTLPMFHANGWCFTW